LAEEGLSDSGDGGQQVAELFPSGCIAGSGVGCGGRYSRGDRGDAEAEPCVGGGDVDAGEDDEGIGVGVDLQ
jgi:hypothetical protein